MSSGVIIAGLGLAAVGFGGRYIARTMPQLAQKMEVSFSHEFCLIYIIHTLDYIGINLINIQAATKNVNFELPKMDAAAWENSKYHKGGFDPKMTKREAALILGVSPNANVKRVGFVPTETFHRNS